MPPRQHLARLDRAEPAGVLAPVEETKEKKQKGAATTSRPWADLLLRTFSVEVLLCPKCAGRMQLLAVVTKEESVVRFLRARGELDEVPLRTVGGLGGPASTVGRTDGPLFCSRGISLLHGLVRTRQRRTEFGSYLHTQMSSKSEGLGKVHTQFTGFPCLRQLIF